MKKTTKFIILTLVAISFFSACQKEGVYKPKKRINRVLIDSEWTDGRVLSAIYTWSGKQLDKITYPLGNKTQNFTYDKKKRISQIIESCGKNYISYEYVYDGKKLDKINCYDNGKTLEVEITFSHDKNKISEITYTYFDYDVYDYYKKSNINNYFLSTIFPNPIIKENILSITNDIIKKKSTNNDKSGIGFQIKCKYTWEKNNIKKIEVEEIDGRDIDVYSIEFTYDEYHNPFYGFLLANDGDLSIESKNNILSITVFEDSDIDMETYRYSYDEDDYPTVRFSSDKHSGTYYFEYE